MGRLMITVSPQKMYALEYDEDPRRFDFSISQVRSLGSVPSYSDIVRERDFDAPSSGVQFGWGSVDFVGKCSGSISESPMSFVILSVSKPLESWQGGGVGRFVEESNPRLNQVFRGITAVSTQARRMVMQIPLLERAGIGAIAGGISGGFTNATLHPIDTVKTKLQTRGASQMYSGPLDVVSKVLADQGIAGLYCGIHAAIVGSIISSSVYFGTYELGKAVFSSITNCPRAIIPPLAAALGNITSSAIFVPKEVIKQRMQTGAVGSASAVFMRTIQTEGFVSLYAGYSAALLRNLPSNVINFSTFEYLKFAWLRKSGKSVLDPWQSVLSGAMAGALSAMVTTPLDVVKTRLMTQARLSVSNTGMVGMSAEATARTQAIAAYTYSGVASMLRQIWLEEGLPGLMKGMGPRLFYSACFSAIGFFAFETTRGFLLIKHLEKKDSAKQRLEMQSL